MIYGIIYYVEGFIYGLFTVTNMMGQYKTRQAMCI
jgi:hypothetical protein